MPLFQSTPNVSLAVEPVTSTAEMPTKQLPSWTADDEENGGVLISGPSDGSLLDYFDHAGTWWQSASSSPSPPPSPPANTSATTTRSPSPSLSSVPGLLRCHSRSSSASSQSDTPPYLRQFKRTRSTSGHRQKACRTEPQLLSYAASISLPSSSRASSPEPTPPKPIIYTCRRTPYYPPNSSRNVEGTGRVYMNRGPHYLPNWTPLSSLPRHVQREIELKSIKFETPPTLEDLQTAADDANADVGGQHVEDNDVAEKGKKQADTPKDIKELEDIGHPGEEVSLPSDIVDAATAKGSGVSSDNANGADKSKQLQLRAGAMVALDAMIAFTSMDLD